jgi:hypothetical protein
MVGRNAVFFPQLPFRAGREQRKGGKGRNGEGKTGRTKEDRRGDVGVIHGRLLYRIGVTRGARGKWLTGARNTRPKRLSWPWFFFPSTFFRVVLRHPDRPESLRIVTTATVRVTSLGWWVRGRG